MSLPISAKEVPFFKLLIPFVAGVASQYWLNLFPYSWGNYIAILVILCLVFAGYFLSSQWRYRWTFGFFTAIFLFFAGAILTVHPPVDQNFIANRSNRAIVRLLDKPQQRVKSIRVQVEVKYLFQNRSWSPVDEKMLVYFDLNDSLALNLEYGSVLVADIVPKPVLPPDNPYQFDFKKYLSDRGVLFTAYLKPDKWALIGNEGGFVKKFALQLRDRLVALFKASGLAGDELAVASALTLGYQDLLDDELRQVYSSSGAMHILSVSGLHVGILYVLLSFLLSSLNKRMNTRILKAIILLVFLWFFALLTGLPPCVQRSALMFSFVVIGDCLSQKSNIYNTIAASAFILLAINPFALVDIGFQLSYLAVISIVFFYSYIYRLACFKSKVIDMVWSLVAVSVAAQFGTFALCIYYFNQFPNYFLLSNLIAIPLSTIALYLAVLLIIVSPFTALAGLVGKVFSLTISVLNHGLEYVEKLPGSVAQGMHLTPLQVLLVFVMVILLSLFFLSKKRSYLFIALAGAICFLGIGFISAISLTKRSEVVVFNIPNRSLVSVCSNDGLLFIDFDSSSNEFYSKYGYFIKGYISNSGGAKPKVINPFSKVTDEWNGCDLKVYPKLGIVCFTLNSKTFVVPFSDSIKNYTTNRTLFVDYLVVNKHYSESMLRVVKPKMLIIDSSVSKKDKAIITSASKKSGIQTYSTFINGAFVLKN